jgi:putative peptidoglycan lipid II flippase
MHKLGHVGIALGTTVSAWLNAAILAVVLHRRGYLKADDRLKNRLPRIILASMIMGGIVWLGRDAVVEELGSIFGAPGTPAGPVHLRVPALASLIGAGIVFYGIAVVLLGVASRDDFKMLRRKRDKS